MGKLSTMLLLRKQITVSISLPLPWLACAKNGLLLLILKQQVLTLKRIAL